MLIVLNRRPKWKKIKLKKPLLTKGTGCVQINNSGIGIIHERRTQPDELHEFSTTIWQPDDQTQTSCQSVPQSVPHQILAPYITSRSDKLFLCCGGYFAQYDGHKDKWIQLASPNYAHYDYCSTFRWYDNYLFAG